ncbi:putative nuclease HARBI1 [Ornithodoros turicata]|uniref:putative nuclease HARBI1 n=1 Tax=Ornithodoros turicata TaxID=34597 RepID=UPI00313A160A
MAEGFFAWKITEAANREPRSRNRQDGFDLDEIGFRGLFRLSKRAAHVLCEELRPYLTPSSERLNALSVETKVLCAQHFFGSGSYQMPVGNQPEIGLPQSSTSSCIHQVINAMQEPEVMQRWIQFPCDSASAQDIKEGFFETYGFPGTLGAIDCTHVAIVAPSLNESAFVNRKGYHSINVQLVCSSEMEILNVNAKYPGSTHDAFIWKNSTLRDALSCNRIPRTNSWLIGDSGCPLKPWLMVPYAESEAASDSSKATFNVRHQKAWAVIEQCNGLLKSRFRCLHRYRPLHYSPSVAGKIINSCAILHNICLREGVELEDPPEIDSEMFDTHSQADQEETRAGGARVRDRVRSQLYAV